MRGVCRTQHRLPACKSPLISYKYLKHLPYHIQRVLLEKGKHLVQAMLCQRTDVFPLASISCTTSARASLEAGFIFAKVSYPRKFLRNKQFTGILTPTTEAASSLVHAGYV